MSTLLKERKVMVAMFFWLRFPEQTLKVILKDAGFTEAPSPPTAIPMGVPGIPPGIPTVEISIGPTRRTLALYKSVKANWAPDKFMLELNGTIADILEIMEKIKDSFKKHKYPLDKVCHYYEITFPPQPVDIDGFVEKLRRKLNIEINLRGEKLKPFLISLSNFDMPVTREKFYKWLHIILNPDVNSPNQRIFIHIIKRETDIDNVVEFVKEIDMLIGKIKEFITGA